MFYLLQKIVEWGKSKTNMGYLERTSFKVIDVSHDTKFDISEETLRKVGITNYYIHDIKNNTYLLADSNITINNVEYLNEIKRVTNEFILTKRLRILNRI